MDASPPNATLQDACYSIATLEAAINHWRVLYPSDRHSMQLCAQAAALAEVYAVMIVHQQEQSPIQSTWKPQAQQAMQDYLLTLQRQEDV